MFYDINGSVDTAFHDISLTLNEFRKGGYLKNSNDRPFECYNSSNSTINIDKEHQRRHAFMQI